MITWMQRHRKYLIITIWISTIAFVGAGFVGWGQYNYGDKAGAVAKVGEIEITRGELQQSYSSLYAQYNQMFQGDFDEEKAKSFGLEKQALNQLTNQALILNLALSYNLAISDQEVLAELKTQKYFFKDGYFDKEIYKSALSRSNISMKDYEADLKKQLLIQKTLKLLPIKINDNEKKILNTIINIADRVEYKILSEDSINIDTSDKSLKPFWETSKQNFMTDIAYELKVIKQEPIIKEYTDSKIKEYYTDNKNHFKDNDGKIIIFKNAKEDVIAELNAKATKDIALRTYINYKKGKLSKDVKIDKITISDSNNPFNAKALEKISGLKIISPYLKPILVGDTYYIFELVKIYPSVPKSFEEAKKSLIPLFIAEQKRVKLLEMAKSSVETFRGKLSDFITNSDINAIPELNSADTNDFLAKLFVQDNKKGYITLNSGNIVLFNIMEQKLLNKQNKNQEDSIFKLKNTMFNEGLIKNLKSKYKTEIFIQGL